MRSERFPGARASGRLACVRGWPLGVTAVLLVLAGCAPPQSRTPFLRSVDLVEMTDRMAESFAATPTVAGRDATDDRWVISIARITNYTNQIIPDREKWLFIGRMQSILAASELADDRAIVWVIPPERWWIVADEFPDRPEPFGLRLEPTHLLTGTFSSLTTTSARGRSDAYLCSFQLVDLATGALVWEDAWEVKRATTGLSYD